ncbi:MAG: alanine racemase [Candidatus Moranbacteria bacterium]|nr:alanine racemase [Candidatus Moranbacteria bacterium]
MLLKQDKKIVNRFERMLEKKSTYKTGTLFHVADSILEKKKRINNLVLKHRTPFYVFDKKNLDESIDVFVDSFKKEIPRFSAYYAMKINHHLLIVERAVKKGLGIDVGSIRELEMAIKAGSDNILYFSPGKTDNDIINALRHADSIRINIDSFGELKRLGILAKKHGKKIRAGVRINTAAQGTWKKYGISLDELIIFWKESKKYPNINLEGIHFHTSRNKDASLYESTIKELGLYLKHFFGKNDLEKIRYVDFGGGFEVYESEGFYPDKTPLGSIIQSVNYDFGMKTNFKERYYVREAIKLEEYAQKIGKVIKTYLEPILTDVEYFSEPGRIICNNSMHIVLSVVDIKDKENVILDGGVNMVGWQRFEYEYFPLVNISNPSKKELKCNMWGNLCTTWDTWGYYCYAEKIESGDIVVVPNQGALTYSLAQNFIQPIPPVYNL